MGLFKYAITLSLCHEGVWGECRYDFTYSYLGHSMEEKWSSSRPFAVWSYRARAPATMLQQAGCISEPVLLLWRRDKAVPAGN